LKFLSKKCSGLFPNRHAAGLTHAHSFIQHGKQIGSRAVPCHTQRTIGGVTKTGGEPNLGGRRTSSWVQSSPKRTNMFSAFGSQLPCHCHMILPQVMNTCRSGCAGPARPRPMPGLGHIWKRERGEAMHGMERRDRARIRIIL
jgi:hypothetical protein